MACKYYINGHEFSNYLLLDEFLLTKELYRKDLGDIVFSKSLAALRSIKKIDTIKTEGEKIKAAHDALKTQIYDATGEKLDNFKGYETVTKYISKFENKWGHILSPEFRVLEYWEGLHNGDKLTDGRFDHWKNNDFTDEELLFLFTPTEEEINNALGDKLQAAKNKALNWTYSQNEADEFRKLITYKWEIQGRTGTAIHEILQFYFSGTNDFNTIKSKLSDSGVLNDELIKLTIAYGRKLYQHLLDKYGDKNKPDSISIYPELYIAGKASKPNLEERSNTSDMSDIVGMIDLLIIGKDGGVHIIDYKTSVKDFNDPSYSTAKTRTYTYLLGLYGRILNQHGISINNISYEIAPIKLDGFEKTLQVWEDLHTETKWQSNDRPRFAFKAVVPYNDNEFTKHLQSYTQIISDPNLAFTKNLSEVSRILEVVEINSEESLQLVVEGMRKWFPKLKKGDWTDEEIIEEIDKNGGIKKNDEGNLIYTPSSKSKPIIIESTNNEKEDKYLMIEKVREWKNELQERRVLTFNNFSKLIDEGLDENIEYESLNFSYNRTEDSSSSTTWLKDTLDNYFLNKKYYERIKDPEIIDLLNYFNIIAIRNKFTKLVEFIRISNSNLKANHYFGNNNKLLLGNFYDDLRYLQDSDSLMLDGSYGNIESMETMLLLNTIAASFKNSDIGTVAGIHIINPITLQGVKASNKELLYCWKEFNKAIKGLMSGKLSINNIDNEHIKFATDYDNFLATFNDVMNRKPNDYLLNQLKTVHNSITNILNPTRDKQLKLLLQLLVKMDLEFKSLGFRLNKEVRSFNKDTHLILYESVIKAIAELKGITFRLLLHKYSQFIDSIDIREGLSGLYTDNPGNLKSGTLNLITTLILEANQNMRDDLLRDYHTLLNKVLAAKDSVNFTWLGERSFILKLDELYKYMSYKNDDGDIMFVNPWINDSKSGKLTLLLRDFLKYVIETINKLRFSNKSEQELIRMRNSGDKAYFQRPLTFKDNSFSKEKLLSTTKEVFNDLIHPTNAIKDITSGISSTFKRIENAKDNVASYNLDFYTIINEFDKDRDELLKTYDANKFEDNLETLLLKMQWAYSTKQHIDEVFPMIKASLIHLMHLGIELNVKYDAEIQYLNDYILNKLKRESLGDPRMKEAEKKLSGLRKAASACMLSFAPVLYYYLLMDGFWKGLMLLTRGNNTKLTRKTLAEAGMYALSDMKEYGNEATLGEMLNFTYGLNDTDASTYYKAINSNKNTFSNLAYRCASRPDYYNRLTIFGAYMRADGCWDAHSKKDGKFEYDWTKDERYKVFAENYDKEDQLTGELLKKYNEAKGRYIAVMLQFINEGAKGKNGELLFLNIKKPMALPRAYTNKEAASIKSLCDTLYGYYSNETKSMIHSTAIGALWMLYRTYWSGKKNLYLLHGGVKLQGEYVQKILKDENGNDVPLWEKIGEDGSVEITEENTGIPHYEWKGKWEEGILVTLSTLLFGNQDVKGIKALAQIWKDNSEIGKVRLANLRLGLYDLLMFTVAGSIIGSILAKWLQDEKKELRKDPSFLKALQVTGALLATRIVGNSFLDLNMFESIGGAVADPTPVAFSWTTRNVKLLYETATGDKDFMDVLQGFSGAARLISPILNYMWDAE